MNNYIYYLKQVLGLSHFVLPEKQMVSDVEENAKLNTALNTELNAGLKANVNVKTEPVAELKAKQETAAELKADAFLFSIKKQIISNLSLNQIDKLKTIVFMNNQDSDLALKQDFDYATFLQKILKSINIQKEDYLLFNLDSNVAENLHLKLDSNGTENLHLKLDSNENENENVIHELGSKNPSDLSLNINMISPNEFDTNLSIDWQQYKGPVFLFGVSQIKLASILPKNCQVWEFDSLFKINTDQKVKRSAWEKLKSIQLTMKQ